MSEQNTNSVERPRMAYRQRYQLAFEVVKNSPVNLEKQEIEKQAGIMPFNAERWLRFQEMYQNEIVVHPVTGKVHFIGAR